MDGKLEQVDSKFKRRFLTPSAVFATAIKPTTKPKPAEPTSETTQRPIPLPTFRKRKR